MLAELRITPVGARISFARCIAHLVPLFAESRVQYQVHALGTTLEGSLDEILALVKRAHEELRKYAERVLIEVSIDDRAGSEGELVRSLEHLKALCVEVPLERLVHGAA